MEGQKTKPNKTKQKSDHPMKKGFMAELRALRLKSEKKIYAGVDIGERLYNMLE